MLSRQGEVVLVDHKDTTEIIYIKQFYKNAYDQDDYNYLADNNVVVIDKKTESASLVNKDRYFVTGKELTKKATDEEKDFYYKIIKDNLDKEKDDA